MRSWVFPLATLLAACATSSTPVDDHPGTFEFEPGLFVPLAASGKADLPNSQFGARPLDTSGYRNIAQLFVAANKDVKRTTQPAAFDWPLSDSRAVLNRAGTPIRIDNLVYEHTGLDVIRVSEMESPVVHAPASGTAQITDWSGTQVYPQGDYSTVISIWDPSTHLVLQLMHVKPDPMLPRNTFFEVQRGQAIGELADPGIPGGRHTHVNVIDAEHFVLVDPVTVIPSYPDTTAPLFDDFYVLDAQAKRYTTLQTGALDLVVAAHDRDDMSPRNIEVQSIAYSATDQAGNVIGSLDRCRLSDAFKVLVTNWSTASTTIRLIDFGDATGQFGGFWPSSDLGNPDRIFRYAVTNLQLVDGQCSVVANDRDGQVMIDPSVTSLNVNIDLWDDRDNHTTKQVTLTR
jgi:hypothetical protein